MYPHRIGRTLTMVVFSSRLSEMTKKYGAGGSTKKKYIFENSGQFYVRPRFKKTFSMI